MDLSISRQLISEIELAYVLNFLLPYSIFIDMQTISKKFFEQLILFIYFSIISAPNQSCSVPLMCLFLLDVFTWCSNYHIF